VGLAGPSVGFLAWATFWFWVDIGPKVLADPRDLENLFAAAILPGGPMALGMAACAIYGVIALRYVWRGPAALIKQTGRLVVALLLAIVPLGFTLTLGAVTLWRESAPEILAMALYGSGVFPLVGVMWLLVLAARADGGAKAQPPVEGATAVQ
ncbi:MAG: hypothetical protein AAGJ94_17525, partial [Pseudomonadota bacterium]